MSQALAHLAAEFRELSDSERVEFCWIVGLAPPADAQADWTEDDFSAAAAQTFARLDAEEEEYALTQT